MLSCMWNLAHLCTEVVVKKKYQAVTVEYWLCLYILHFLSPCNVFNPSEAWLCWAAACQRLIDWDEICAGIQPGPLASLFLEAPAHASCLDAGLGGWMLQPPKAAPILGMFKLIPF